MKTNKISLWWLCISLLAAFSLTACNKGNEKEPAITFPEKQLIEGYPSDSEFHSLSFEAATDWTLTSSGTWCYFAVSQSGEANVSKEYTISGKAGKQTVQIGISAEGQDFDNKSVAEITITMKGKEAVLAEVTRNEKKREIKIFKEVEGEGSEKTWAEVSEEEGIEAGYDEYKNYKITANFRFAATEMPEWLEIEKGSITGEAGEEVKFGLQVVNSNKFIKYAQNGSIIFRDEAGKASFNYPVKYAGMDPEAIKCEGPRKGKWTVSLDGKTFTQTMPSGPGTGEENTEYKDFVEYTITALNDDFEIVFLEKYEMMPGNPKFKTSISGPKVDWMHAEKLADGKIKLTVDGASKQREGYVLAFPKVLYERIKESHAEDLFDVDPETFQKELKYIYTQRNLLIHFVQKDNTAGGEEKGIEIVSQYWESYGEKVECTEITGDDALFYKSEFMASKVFTVSASKCASIRVKVPFEVDSFMARYEENVVTDTYCKIPEDGTTKAVDIWGCQGLQKELIVVIRDALYQKVTVLAIRP